MKNYFLFIIIRDFQNYCIMNCFMQISRITINYSVLNFYYYLEAIDRTRSSSPKVHFNYYYYLYYYQFNYYYLNYFNYYYQHWYFRNHLNWYYYYLYQNCSLLHCYYCYSTITSTIIIKIMPHSIISQGYLNYQ